MTRIGPTGNMSKAAAMVARSISAFWCNAIKSRCSRICRNRIGDPGDVEEAAQESFVRAFLSLKKLRKPESFCFWLLGIAGRVASEQFRSAAQRARNRQAAEGMMAVAVEEDREEYPLEEVIAALPETYRRVILLRYYEGLSCQGVATRLDMPLSTITKTLSRAYALLRQELRARESSNGTFKPTEPYELR